MVFRSWQGVGVAVLTCLMAGCSGDCWENEDAHYLQTFAKNWGPEPYPIPANTWGRSALLEEFLRDKISQGGLKVLVDKLRFQCTPDVDRSACTNCHICDRTRPAMYYRISLFPSLGGPCEQDGDIRIRAYVGPGTSVNAMTYWRK